jgi:hypothetical protein
MLVVGHQNGQDVRVGSDVGRSTVRTVRAGSADGPRAQNQLGF